MVIIVTKYNRCLLICLCLLIFLPQNAAAKCGAGTVLYATFEGKTHLLLADHQLISQRHRGWSGFGGLCDGQSAAVAAARETEEETRGYYKSAKILAKLGGKPSIRIGDFTTYFVEVDYVPTVDLINQKPPGSTSHYIERGPYAWVPLAAIRQAFDNRQAGRAHIAAKYLPPDARTNWFFEPFLTSLMEAETAGILPWTP